MTKLILFIIFVALFIYIVTTPIGQAAITGVSDIITGFYDDFLVYGSKEIFAVFALFCFVIGYGLIKH